MAKMYKSGPNMVAKPDRRSRTRFNIEMGLFSYGIGVHDKKIKSTSHIGPQWMDPDVDSMDEVCIMDDGKVLCMIEHEDC